MLGWQAAVGGKLAAFLSKAGPSFSQPPPGAARFRKGDWDPVLKGTKTRTPRMPQAIIPASFLLQMGKLRPERGSDFPEVTRPDRSDQPPVLPHPVSVEACRGQLPL